MQIPSVRFGGFMAYQATHLITLPPVGLVLVTGPNGSGKSALLEAVSYAGWGKTLRGTDPRRIGEGGETVIITSFGMEVDRSWSSKGTKFLTVRLTGDVDEDLQQEAHKFENNSKAQDHVEAILGPWETWRRSCVFSTVDDMSFASATDADRKRLLESILGMARFDLALTRCRDDARKAQNELGVAVSHLGTLNTRRESAQGYLAKLRAMVTEWDGPPDTTGLADQAAALAADVTFKEMEVSTEREAADRHRTEQARWEATDRQMNTTGRSLASDPTCPTCGQEMPDATHRAAKLEAHRAAHRAHRATQPAPFDRTGLDAAERALNATRADLARVNATLANARQEERRYNEARQAVTDAETELGKLEQAILVVEREVGELSQRHTSLTTVDTVLGTRGARAHLLARSLAGLEQAANVWLNLVARTDAPLSLHLSPYTEKKTGGTSDAISMEIAGAGGGKGYKAASGGERRRIDVALMLALAEVAMASDNRVAPTMWFDEVFDALDTPGVLAVCNAVEQLAQDRCVVVITHNEELIASLTPDVRLRVAGGTIEVE